MVLDKLLQNPEHYRCGDNYLGSSIVFPAEFEGRKYIVKQPRQFSPAINAYYALQDKFFFGTRRLMQPEDILEAEYQKLQKLQGIGSPIPYGFDGKTLIREYIEGSDFRSLPFDYKVKSLEDSLKAMEIIHERGVAIGDAHVKNTVMRNGGLMFWLLSGAYDESNLTKAKAVDLLKFVYSSYTAIRDEKVAVHAARLASNYNNNEVKACARALIEPVSAARLWFPTRVPLDGKLHKEIKGILKG